MRLWMCECVICFTNPIFENPQRDIKGRHLDHYCSYCKSNIKYIMMEPGGVTIKLLHIQSNTHTHTHTHIWKAYICISEADKLLLGGCRGRHTDPVSSDQSSRKHTVYLKQLTHIHTHTSTWAFQCVCVCVFVCVCVCVCVCVRVYVWPTSVQQLALS